MAETESSFTILPDMAESQYDIRAREITIALCDMSYVRWTDREYVRITVRQCLEEQDQPREV